MGGGEASSDIRRGRARGRQLPSAAARRRLLAWAAWALLLAVVCIARPALSDASPAARRGEKTISRRLDNGLEVVLSEARAQPVFSLALQYRVGDRNDPADLNELAHLAEHLSFHFSRYVDGPGFEVSSLAGVSPNGRTGQDETVYLSSGPAGALERVLWLERQRMAFSVESFNEQDVVTERRILDNERSTRGVGERVGGLFWPLVTSELYPPGHPYLPREERGCIVRCKLQHVQWLMQRGYRPDNARLVVVGDFDADALFESVSRVFGSIENPGVSLPPLAVPAPRSDRHGITIAAPVARSSLHLYWDVPQTLQAKLPTLRVLRAELELLLQRDLVAVAGLASDVDVELRELDLGWLWIVQAELLPGVDPKLVEKRALAQVARLAQQARLPGGARLIESARHVEVTDLLEAWDHPDGRAWLLSQERGFGFDLGKAMAELRRVSAGDVTALIQQFLLVKPRLSVHVRRAIGAARRGELYREPT